MKLSNVYNLPEAMVNAMSNFQKPSKDVIRVSELINAPKQKELRIKHWNKIEEDVSERLWALLGNAVHYILEKGAPTDGFGEERLKAKIAGVTISGQSDLFHDGIVEDYKTTSVNSYTFGTKPEWIAQLNIYRWLWYKAGFKVKALKIHCILRDWIKSKAMLGDTTFKDGQRVPNYPPIPFVTIDIPMWTIEETEQYILNRICLHQMTPAPPCTDEEKWTRPTTYAIMEKGGKRAKRVLSTMGEAKLWMKANSKWSIKISDFKITKEPFEIIKEGLKRAKAVFKTLEEAEKYIEDNETLFVEVRKGINVRCEGYCNVAKWCDCK